MELRKDPITRSWVIVGDDEERPVPHGYCPFCPGSSNAPQVIISLNSGPGASTAMVHPAPLYRIEGEPHRRAGGLSHALRSPGPHGGVGPSVRHDNEVGQTLGAQMLRTL